MKLTDYIIDRLFSVVMFLVAVIFSMGLLWLMGLRYEFIIYIEIIFGSVSYTHLTLPKICSV